MDELTSDWNNLMIRKVWWFTQTRHHKRPPQIGHEGRWPSQRQYHHHHHHHSHRPSYHHQYHPGYEGFEDVSDPRCCVHCVLDSLYCHGNMVGPISRCMKDFREAIVNQNRCFHTLWKVQTRLNIKKEGSRAGACSWVSDIFWSQSI